MTNFKRLLRQEFLPHGILSDTQLDLLESHFSLLSTWNRRINLTRIREFEDSVRLNYCESLFLAKSLPEGSLRIVDVGSGAGFPGIPVAIFRPECQVDLVESHQRKAAFLREASHELPNIRVISQRAEECVPDYHWLISRAVSRGALGKLNLAPNSALLVGGDTGLPIPWGRGRRLLIVSRGT